MERMDADGSQYIRVHPSRSVFYSREFRVIARAGRKVSHPLDGRNTGIRVHISPGARASCPRRRDAGGDACAPRGRPRAQGVTPYRIFWKPLHVICPFRHQDTQTPPSPLVGLGNAYRGRFLGKPLRVIYRFRHQDAQNPPSPLVGEGGRGDEGQKRAGMQNITHLSQEIYP